MTVRTNELNQVGVCARTKKGGSHRRGILQGGKMQEIAQEVTVTVTVSDTVVASTRRCKGLSQTLFSYVCSICTALSEKKVYLE